MPTRTLTRDMPQTGHKPFPKGPRLLIFELATNRLTNWMVVLAPVSTTSTNAKIGLSDASKKGSENRMGDRDENLETLANLPTLMNTENE
jgi:hypothetical protein